MAIVGRAWIFTGVLVAGLAGAAEAVPLNIPVPTNATITHNGLVWAWAAPCNPVEPSCGVIDLSFQGAFGWHIPTEAEFLIAPLAPDFVFPGANVPLGGGSPNGASFSDSHLVPGDAACAAPFFSTTHSHCDWKNAPGSGEFGSMPWGEDVGLTTIVSEALVVRPIPEPSTALLVGLGLLAMGARRRA